MSRIRIGTEYFDYNEDIEVIHSVGDIGDIEQGSLITSMDVDIPNTDVNVKLLKYTNNISSSDEITLSGVVENNEIEILNGKITVLSSDKNANKIQINSTSWISDIEELLMTDLNLSAYDALYSRTNVIASWTASSGAFIRYPLVSYGIIDYGTLVYATSSFYPSDFTPWFNVLKLIESILSGYTIQSTFLNSTYFKSLYIIGSDPIKDNGYLEAKLINVKVEATTDNYNSEDVGAGLTESFELVSNPVVINKVVEMEGTNWSASEYTIPETGTYRFMVTASHTVTATGLTLTNKYWEYDLMKKPLVGVDLTLDFKVGTTITPSASLDSGYIHFEAGEKVYLKSIVQFDAYNSTPDTIAASAYVNTATEFKATPVKRWLYPGIGVTIEPEKYMPKMKQIDFLNAVKGLFNLIFWQDKPNKTIYIEPRDTFFTSEVIDITSYLNFDNIEKEYISTNYAKSIRMLFQNDSVDIELNKYNQINTVLKGEKYITLTSNYCKPEISSIINTFSTFITELMYPYPGPICPRIWGTQEDENKLFPIERLNGFNTKIGVWEGNVSTASQNWTFEGAKKTSYPKMSGIDLATIYPTYWAKTFHYIDKSKLLVIEGVSNINIEMQLNTVINDATKEGLRPIYKFTYLGEDYYCRINSYRTNGKQAIYELMLII